ncbi:hypothetical protein CRM22_006759 [Opisthorchis felineus]|uniref:MD-2-related lipid-recognition domain-containing protein n=1 Tax=Opisthorchis felineus TaxID=147828 RepID=A0A4S2LLB2_OPIFE|nr:hypothetical protein CRM22_006759 [Opisthorchis felineus]
MYGGTDIIRCFTVEATMRFLHTWLLVTAVLKSASTRTLSYEDCGSTVQIKSVKMKPCKLSPCELTKLGNDTIQIKFQTDSDAGSPGDSGFYGTFQGTTFPFFVERPKICDNIKPHCPLKPSSRYTYKNTVSTSEAYPNVHLTGRWVLNNTEGKPMVCVQFPIQIVEK